MTENQINLAADWHDILEKEFSKKYFKNLISFLRKEEEKHTVYPSSNKRFEALNLTPFNDLKIVIIGQANANTGPYQVENMWWVYIKWQGIEISDNNSTLFGAPSPLFLHCLKYQPLNPKSLKPKALKP